MAMENFEIIKDIENGSFGVVFLVKRKLDSIIYALKRVNFTNLNSKERINSLNEIRFNHQFLIKTLYHIKNHFMKKKLIFKFSFRICK